MSVSLFVNPPQGWGQILLLQVEMDRLIVIQTIKTKSDPINSRVARTVPFFKFSLCWKWTNVPRKVFGQNIKLPPQEINTNIVPNNSCNVGVSLHESTTGMGQILLLQIITLDMLEEQVDIDSTSANTMCLPFKRSSNDFEGEFQEDNGPFYRNKVFYNRDPQSLMAIEDGGDVEQPPLGDANDDMRYIMEAQVQVAVERLRFGRVLRAQDATTVEEELEEIMGAMLGLREETIMKYIKHENFVLEDKETQEMCCICQEEYVNGDEVGKLDWTGWRWCCGVTPSTRLSLAQLIKVSRRSDVKVEVDDSGRLRAQKSSLETTLFIGAAVCLHQ
ncbi:hypothetical protein SESBI_05696 [Sesbania bispinosa]|nr:hypothetical protein SESBI_05696 [Sesbania bispinosa]